MNDALYDRYRLEDRSIEVFAEFIATGTHKERIIIDNFVRHYEIKYGMALEVEDNGCDNSGKLLPLAEVNTQADFIVNGKPVEVKFNNHRLLRFHFKACQLDSYLKQEAYVLWVNGYETDSPVFTVLQLQDLERIKKTKRPVTFAKWGGKLCYEMDAQDYRWLKFERGNDVEEQ